MKSVSFDQLPVGTDFYCFGAKWNKTSEGAALLVRAKRRPRKPRCFAAAEPVLPVGGVQQFLLSQMPLILMEDDEGMGCNGEGCGFDDL